MKKILTITLTSLALAAPTAVVFAGPAEAATHFANCDAMHRTFAHGVSRSHAAARRQVRTGHLRPAVRPAVYWANSGSDADKDGTACEVTR
jgi:hypothetical protein